MRSKTLQCTVCKQYDLAAIIIIRSGTSFIFVMFGVWGVFFNGCVRQRCVLIFVVILVELTNTVDAFAFVHISH